MRSSVNEAKTLSKKPSYEARKLVQLCADIDKIHTRLGDKKSPEDERLEACIKYFERGCLCIRNGTLEKCGDNVPAKDAVNIYENSCKCSRNYKERVNEKDVLDNGEEHY